MTKLTVVSCISIGLVAGAAAVACDDSSSGDSPGGASGSGNEAGSESNGGGSGGSSGGSSNPSGGVGGDDTTGPMGGDAPGGSGSGGALGGAGADNGGANAGGTGEGGSGGATDPGADNTCESFPVTVTLGPTIVLNQTGAIVCLDMCRITTNTYSDGDGACANADTGISFFYDSSSGGSYRAYLQSTWEFVSASAGTINQSFAYSLEAIPSGTAVTAVLGAPGNVEYTVVFEFEGGSEFTITSFTQN